MWTEESNWAFESIFLWQSTWDYSIRIAHLEYIFTLFQESFIFFYWNAHFDVTWYGEKDVDCMEIPRSYQIRISSCIITTSSMWTLVTIISVYFLVCESQLILLWHVFMSACDNYGMDEVRYMHNVYTEHLNYQKHMWHVMFVCQFSLSRSIN